VVLSPKSKYFLHFWYEDKMYRYPTMIVETNGWKFQAREVFSNLRPLNIEMVVDAFLDKTTGCLKVKEARIVSPKRVKSIVFRYGYVRAYSSYGSRALYDAYNKFYYSSMAPFWTIFCRGGRVLGITLMFDDGSKWDTGWFGVDFSEHKYFLKPYENKWSWYTTEPPKSIYGEILRIWKIIIGEFR